MFLHVQETFTLQTQTQATRVLLGIFIGPCHGETMMEVMMMYNFY